MIRLTTQEFENVVEKALHDLPEKFANSLENIEIFVEDYPTLDVQRSMGISRRGLLGLYTGVPLPQRSRTWAPLYPDRIVLYQRNLEAYSRTRTELIEQIQRTVLHEIGHYFGIHDKRLRQLGF